jgi:hypothetical protein
MIRLIAVAFALAVATSAEAMSPAPLHEPDAMITQVRKARPARNCWIPTRYELMVSASLMPPLSPQPSTRVLNGMKACALSTMGRSRGGGLVKPKAKGKPWPPPTVLGSQRFSLTLVWQDEARGRGVS